MMVGANYEMYRESFRETEYRLVLKLKALFELMQIGAIDEEKVRNTAIAVFTSFGSDVEKISGYISINLEEPLDTLSRSAFNEIISTVFEESELSTKFSLSQVSYDEAEVTHSSVNIRIECCEKKKRKRSK